jgi:hypothetical protein
MGTKEEIRKQLKTLEKREIPRSHSLAKNSARKAAKQQFTSHRNYYSLGVN